MLARNVSRAKRLAQVASSVVACFFLAGLVFGFAALKPILIDAGVYANLCDGGVSGCAAQDTRLNILFVVATSTTNCASLPIGWFLDTVGPQVATITGAVVFGSGALTFGIGNVGRYIDTYMIGYFLMALGSPALILAQFHLSNAFPKRSGLVLGAITGAFDASSMPLVFFKQSYFALGSPSLHTFFTCYAILPLLLVIQQLTLAPTEVYELLSDADDDTIVPDVETPTHSTIQQAPSLSRKQRIERLTTTSAFSRFSSHRGLDITPMHNHESQEMSSAFSRVSQIESVQLSRRMSSAFSRVHYDICDNEGDDVLAAVLEDKGGHDGVVGVMFGRSVREQITSKWFWAMEFVLIVHMTRINWYLATVQAQLVYCTHDVDLADQLTDAFTILLPAAGLVMVPAVGWLIDHRPQRDVSLVMMTLGLVFGTVTLLSSTAAQLVGIAALVCFRPLFYTAISDYAAKVFGFETFGTVYGLAMTLSGAVGVVLTPLDRAVKGSLGGNYTPVNIVLLIMGVISTAVLAWRCSGRAADGMLRIAENEDEGEA